MKKIFMAIALCLMCAVNGFGEICRFEKVNFPTDLTDGDYIICYETSSKVKVFQQFDEFAVSVTKENDTTILCDNSLAWEFEKIDGNLFALSNNKLEYLHTEQNNIVISNQYGIIRIGDNGSIFTYKRNEYYNGEWDVNYLIYKIEENIFTIKGVRVKYNNSNGVPTNANSNTSIYKKVKNDNSVATNIEFTNSEQKGTKQIINGVMYIINGDKTYDIFGQKVD